MTPQAAGDDAAARKAAALRRLLATFDAAIVAYSGGADSAFLASEAHAVLGPRALAITADSPSYPERHRRLAVDIARQFGFRHQIVRTAEIERAEYRANPENRCYFCKHELYTLLQQLAADRGFRYVVDGNNLDDTGDYRPGRKAGAELEIRSPLIEAGLRKTEIRELSRQHGLPTWNQAASACLSSRIPYGSPVTIEKLRMIDRGEEILRGLGFHQFRVRHHGEVARIEFAPEEMPKALHVEVFDRIGREFRKVGFQFVAVDVQGYRSGALNEVLTTITPLKVSQ